MMSLYKTATHVSQKNIILATFAVKQFTCAQNWFSKDMRKTMIEWGYRGQRLAARWAKRFRITRDKQPAATTGLTKPSHDR